MTLEEILKAIDTLSDEDKAKLKAKVQDVEKAEDEREIDKIEEEKSDVPEVKGEKAEEVKDESKEIGKDVDELKEEVSEDVIKKDILGSETLKTLNTATYEIINTIDGVSQNILGRWNFDDLYFTKIEENNNKIILKAKNKTGTTLIEFITEDSVITKNIKIVPLFGGI